MTCFNFVAQNKLPVLLIILVVVYFRSVKGGLDKVFTGLNSSRFIVLFVPTLGSLPVSSTVQQNGRIHYFFATVNISVVAILVMYFV